MFPYFSLAAESDDKKDKESRSQSLREYHCLPCDKVLHLSSIDILKHKRWHAQHAGK